MPTRLPPVPCAIICRAAARRVRYVPSRLTAISARQASSVESTNRGLPHLPVTAALAKHESSRPYRDTTVFIPSSTARSSLTSTIIAMTSVPVERRVSSAAAFLPALVPQMQTALPARASPVAIPSPIPEFPPVTRATWPLRSNRVSSIAVTSAISTS